MLVKGNGKQAEGKKGEKGTPKRTWERKRMKDTVLCMFFFLILASSLLTSLQCTANTHTIKRLNVLTVILYAQSMKQVSDQRFITTLHLQNQYYTRVWSENSNQVQPQACVSHSAIIGSYHVLMTGVTTSAVVDESQIEESHTALLWSD